MRIPVRARRVALWIVAAVVVIQLFPAWLWQRNPPTAREPAWDAPRTRFLAAEACFDCHSNETVWPGYARVAPVSWLVTWDVVTGRASFNFSDWRARTPGGAESRARGESADEVVKAVREGDMPPGIYKMMHPRSRLDVRDRDALVQGLLLTLR